MQTIAERTGCQSAPSLNLEEGDSEKIYIIPPRRVRYLSEIAETIRTYDRWTDEQATIANRLQHLSGAAEELRGAGFQPAELGNLHDQLSLQLDKAPTHSGNVGEKVARYKVDEFVYQVRGRDIRVPTKFENAPRNRIARVAAARATAWGDILKWNLRKTYPANFPHTAGVFSV